MITPDYKRMIAVIFTFYNIAYNEDFEIQITNINITSEKVSGTLFARIEIENPKDIPILEKLAEAEIGLIFSFDKGDSTIERKACRIQQITFHDHDKITDAKEILERIGKIKGFFEDKVIKQLGESFKIYLGEPEE